MPTRTATTDPGEDVSTFIGPRPWPPRQGWTDDQVLHFRPRRYECWSQSLEVTFGEVMTGGVVAGLSRIDAMELHADLCQRAVLDSNALAWPPSPMAGVGRRMLAAQSTRQRASALE